MRLRKANDLDSLDRSKQLQAMINEYEQRGLLEHMMDWNEFQRTCEALAIKCRRLDMKDQEVQAPDQTWWVVNA